MADTQRREGYRVRPPQYRQPRLHLPHPVEAGRQLSLPVFDLAHGGLAIVVPPELPLPVPGALLGSARLELEPGLTLMLALRVVHRLEPQPSDQGPRLGCEIVALSGEDARALQRYLLRTQIRNRTLC